MSDQLPKTQSFLCPAISWLLETRILGHADQASVVQAISDWKQHGRLNNMILDCTYLESIDQLSLLAGASLLKECSPELQRIALVADASSAMAAPMIEKQSGILVKHFTDRAEAIRWYRRGCPA